MRLQVVDSDFSVQVFACSPRVPLTSFVKNGTCQNALSDIQDELTEPALEITLKQDTVLLNLVNNTNYSMAMKSRLGMNIHLTLPAELPLNSDSPLQLSIRQEESLEETIIEIIKEAPLYIPLEEIITTQIEQDEVLESTKEKDEVSQKEMMIEITEERILLKESEVNEAVVESQKIDSNYKDNSNKLETSLPSEEKATLLQRCEENKENVPDDPQQEQEASTPIKKDVKDERNLRSNRTSSHYKPVHPKVNQLLFYNHNNVLTSSNLEELDFTESYFVRKRKGVESAKKSVGSNKKKQPQDDECCICYAQLNDELSGLLPNCKHKFCYSCIVNWSNVCTKCPLCKVEFKEIYKVRRGIRIEALRVKPKGLDDEVEEEDPDAQIVIENTDEFCYVCNELGDSLKLLVCDHCNFKLCHTSCLDNPIDWIPEEDFYCIDCCKNYNLKNDFRPPQLFNAELYTQIREEAEQRVEQAQTRQSRELSVAPPQHNRRVRGRGGRRPQEPQIPQVHELHQFSQLQEITQVQDEVQSEDSEQQFSTYARSLYTRKPEDIQKAREGRQQRLEKRQKLLEQMEEGVIPMRALPQKYKPSPVKKESKLKLTSRINNKQRENRSSGPWLLTSGYDGDEDDNNNEALQPSKEVEGQSYAQKVENWFANNAVPKIIEKSDEEDYECDEEELNNSETDEEESSQGSEKYGRKGGSFKPNFKSKRLRARQSKYDTTEHWDGVAGVQQKLCGWGASSRGSSQDRLSEENFDSSSDGSID